ncbi:MAG: DUF2330 domain-containing protein [Polyangiaceae bacterium]|nr:DUF2330 domain-containing protein [Polyangiaceae bacterium]
MRLANLFLALPLAALALTHAQDAAACGGCFITQGESTVVTGHKMILSTSAQGTTLWDQIVYAGDPSSFAWVLPVHGLVEVGLSSDALFQTLEALTQVSISSPTIDCTPPPCPGQDGNFSGGATSTATGGEEPVTVVAQETVGPYETVQLSSQDPQALQAWLASHGYNVPADITPVISTYVTEGLNFLALKLVPGMGVDAMRPIRITTPGASATLPLRMVAAGTGAITPITLWVLGEGRYEPQNFPSFEINPGQLVWNWDEQRSNYAELKQAGFDATNGAGWLIEAGEQVSRYSIEYPLQDLIQYDPASSGYVDDSGATPAEELQADLEKLYGGIPDGSLWINRFHGELTRPALADDLDLQASADQSYVNRYFEATQAVGTPPECPPAPPCDEYPPDGSPDPLGANGGDVDLWGGGGSCAMEQRGAAQAALGGLAALAALSLVRRRRRTS